MTRIAAVTTSFASRSTDLIILALRFGSIVRRRRRGSRLPLSRSKDKECGGQGTSRVADAPPALTEARLVRRYKRFLADVELAGGEVVTVHCANPGVDDRARRAGHAGLFCRGRTSPAASCRCRGNWSRPDGGLVGINTAHPNGLVAEAIGQRVSPSLPATATFRREVAYGTLRGSTSSGLAPAGPTPMSRSRTSTSRARPASPNSPTASTARGAEHLAELADMVAAGHRAVMLYLVQRGDTDAFSPRRRHRPGLCRRLRSRPGRRGRDARLPLPDQPRGDRGRRRHCRSSADRAILRRGAKAAISCGLRVAARASRDLMVNLHRCHPRPAQERRPDQASRRGRLCRHAPRRPPRRRVPRRARATSSARACRPRRSTASSTIRHGPRRPARRRSATRATRSRRCISINHVVCHGIPSDKPLRDGDIVNIDVTLIVDGWHGDSSRMYAVGDVKRAAERLIEVTYEAMMRGIAGDPARAPPPATSATPSRTTPSASAAASSATSAATASAGSSTTRPTSCTTAAPATASSLKPGMIFTVEPMINLGRPQVKILVRRLDGGDPRPLALGAVRALGRRHRDRLSRSSRSRRRGLAPATAVKRAMAEASATQSGDVAPLSRPSRAPAERFREAGGDDLARLRAARADALPGDPAPRHQAARQGAARAIRQLLRGARRARSRC